MDLSHPLQTLVPSLDGATLEVLAGTQSGLSVTDIARLASRGTRQGHLLVLDRLVASGLVHALPANRGSLYRLNRDHLLAALVVEAARARATVVTRLSEALASLDPRPLHASLFGSFARREADHASDIDLLIITPDAVEPDDRWTQALQVIADDVLAWTGNRLESVVLTPSEFDDAVRAREPIAASWLSDSQVLIGPTLEALVTKRGP